MIIKLENASVYAKIRACFFSAYEVNRSIMTAASHQHITLLYHVYKLPINM